MSDYIMSPGADLYVGPGGRPYESMGQATGMDYDTWYRGIGRPAGIPYLPPAKRKKPCCDDCASGKKKCGGGALGALLDESGHPVPVQPAGPSIVAPQVPVAPSSSSMFGLPEWALPVAAVGAGVFVIVKLLKRKSPRSNPRRRRRR